MGLILLVLVLLGAGGGGGYYWFVMRPQQLAVVPTGPLAADSTHRNDGVDGLDSAYSALTTNPGAHPAPRDTTAGAAATPPPPAGVPGDSGSLRIGQIPRGAEVMVDGRQMHQNPSKLPAGEHDVLITAQGYDNFRQRVRVSKDQVFTLTPELRRFGQTGQAPPTPTSREVTPVAGGRPAGANCAEPGATYNINNVCWDKRPRPSDATPPAVPVSDQNMQGARPTILNIHVSAQGGTIEVRPVRPSNDPGFEDLAKRYARAMQWTPASKNGTAVDSWVQQQLVPTAP